MSCHPRVTAWATTLQTHLPHLSKPQVMVLAWWRLGRVLARSCALPAVSAGLAPWFPCKDNTLRQRLRECCYPAQAKRGNHRQALVVETGVAPLLAWVLSRWEGTPLALALEATAWGDRLTVLVLSVVYRSGAIPIAWTVLTAHVEKAWRPGVVAAASPAAPRGTAPRDRYRTRRSGVVGALVVATDHPAGVAPVAAPHYRRYLPAPRRSARDSSQDPRAPTRSPVVRYRRRLPKSPAPAHLYAPGALGTWLARPGVHLNRFTADRQRGLLVGVTRLD